jgi:hypothetical protein
VSRRRTGLALALIAVGALVHVVRYAGPFEDAFITFRYARNVAAGLGPVFNPGERVEGATSLGWLYLLAAGASAGLPLVPLATILSALAAFGLLAASAALGRRLVSAESWHWILVPAFVAASGTWAYYAGTGMETTLFALLATTAAALLFEPRAKAVAWAAVLVAVASAFRPEGVAYACAFACALTAARSTRRQALVFLAIFAALYLPFFVARWGYYGFPFPNTYYAKAAPSFQLFARGAAYAEEFLTSSLSWIALVWLAVRFRHGDPTPRTRVAASVCAVACVNSVWVGGDAFAFFRLMLPALPMFAALTADALARLARVPRGRWWSIVLCAAACVEFAVSPALPRYSLTRRGLPSFAATVAQIDRLDADYFAVGAWMREHLQPSAVVAIDVAGIVPYESRLPTIDMLGLTDAHIAHRPIELGRGIAGHEKHDAEYVLARAPDVIVLGLPVLSPSKLHAKDLSAWLGRWLPYLPGDASMLETHRFQRDYSLASVPVAGRGWFTFFVRRSALGSVFKKKA